MTEIIAVPRGLDSVAVDDTGICLADTDRLYYRGYAIEELAAPGARRRLK